MKIILIIILGQSKLFGIHYTSTYNGTDNIIRTSSYEVSLHVKRP